MKWFSIKKFNPRNNLIVKAKIRNIATGWNRTVYLKRMKSINYGWGVLTLSHLEKPTITDVEPPPLKRGWEVKSWSMPDEKYVDLIEHNKSICLDKKAYIQKRKPKKSISFWVGYEI